MARVRGPAAPRFLAREAANARLRHARATSRSAVRHARASARTSRTAPSRWRSTWAKGRVLRVSGQIDRIDAREDGSLVLRDYKTGQAPGRATTPASSAAGASSRSPSTCWPRSSSSRRSAWTRPSSTTWTAAARSPFDPVDVTGERVPHAPAHAHARHRRRALRAGAVAVPLVRLHGGLRPAAAAGAAPAVQAARPPRCASTCACGTADELRPPPTSRIASARARLARRDARAGGRRRHRQDDAARRPHRVAAAQRRRASSPRSRPSPSPRTRPPR